MSPLQRTDPLRPWRPRHSLRRRRQPRPSSPRREVRRASLLLGLTALAGACAPPPPPGQLVPGEVETTLFLIGDAGEPDPRGGEAALDSLAAQASVAPERSIIVFLGDNVYPAGVPREGEAEWADARRRLEAQVRTVPRGARGIFIAGNHDWAYGEPFGLYAVRLQEELIEALADGRDVRMLPGRGCPGPAVLEEGRLRLVLLDTQWWLHDYIVTDAESNCATTTGEVTAALRAALDSPAPRQVSVVAGHHPLMTGGKHGGYCGVTGPFHRFGGQSQDIVSSANRTMRDSLEAAFVENPPLVYVGAHDHNLQVLRGTGPVPYLLVSGAGSYAKAACAVHLRESYYVAQDRSGFMRLDILRDQGVLLSVYRFRRDGRGGLAYSRWLRPRGAAR